MNIDFLQPRRWLLLILLLTGSTALQQAVACTTTASDINLGTTSSLTLPTTTSQAAGAGGLTCAGSLQLLTGVYLRATLLSNTLVLTGDQGGSVPFTVYSDSGYTQAMLTGQTATLAGANLLAIGGSGISVPLYARTQLGANVPAGTYTGTISVRWYWAICPSGLLNICTWDTSPGVVQPTGLGCVLNCTPTNWGTGELAQISIKLIVTKACQLSALSAVVSAPRRWFRSSPSAPRRWSCAVPTPRASPSASATGRTTRRPGVSWPAATTGCATTSTAPTAPRSSTPPPPSPR